MKSKIGIIGGSGLDDPKLLTVVQETMPDTPYGKPSSPLVCGRLAGRDVVMLSRHGRGHTIPPTQINNRANLWALEKEGCRQVISTAACGSLREDIGRGAIIVPDQFIDFTRHRVVTFHESFASGIENARHTPMADPFDAKMRALLVESGRRMGLSPMTEARY
jgi:5'-methylthioadenosine phosphorylase